MANGKIVQIIGPVVDVEFPADQMPDIYNALLVEIDPGADDTGEGKRTIYAEVALHIGDNLVLNYTFLQANKTKQGRGASATRPPATTWNQGGPSPVHTGKVQYTLNDNNYVEASINNTGLGFFLEPQGGRDVPQVNYEYADGSWANSYFYYDTDRPLWNVRVDANTYIAGDSMDHEFKYGYSFRDAGVYSDSGIGSASGIIVPLMFLLLVAAAASATSD